MDTVELVGAFVADDDEPGVLDGLEGDRVARLVPSPMNAATRPGSDDRDLGFRAAPVVVLR